MSETLKSSRRLDPAYQVRIRCETVRHWMEAFARLVRDREMRLTELDAAIGDGDHGINMRRGMGAVAARLNEMEPQDLSGQFRVISAALITSVGGAAGPLYGTFFLHAAQMSQHKAELSLGDLALTVEAGYRGVAQLGKAAVGDKTMVDTLAAVVVALRAAAVRHDSLPVALQACREQARAAAIGTTPMVARKGRASYLGERSAGCQDPGATSAALLFEALSRAVSETMPALPDVTSSSDLPQPTLAPL